MYDSRLNILIRAGYSWHQIHEAKNLIPKETLEKIAAAETPREAKRLFRDGLADNKVETDEGE